MKEKTFTLFLPFVLFSGVIQAAVPGGVFAQSKHIAAKIINKARYDCLYSSATNPNIETPIQPN